MARMIFSAPTREEALQRAAEELGLPADALEAEVLDDTTDQEDVEEEPGVCVRVRVSLSYAAGQAVELLRGLIAAMGISGQVEAQVSGAVIELSITGASSSLLIGRDGHTLDAIQHWLTRAIAKVTCASPKLLVDVENYRQRKFDKLRSMARRVARRVVQTLKAERLSAMGPVERKFVHNSLKDIDGVMTYSLGREGRRHVVIAPKDDEEAQRQRLADTAHDDDDHDHDDDQDGVAETDEGADTLPTDDLLSSHSTYSSLRVIATPTNLDTGDKEIEDELDDSLFSPRDLFRKRRQSHDDIEDELH